MNLVLQAIEEQAAASSSSGGSSRIRGRVISFAVKKGFGFIQPLESVGFEVDERGLFVHRSSIVCRKGTPCLVVGADVLFIPDETGPNGRPCAKDVTDLEGNPLPGYEGAHRDT